MQHMNLNGDTPAKDPLEDFHFAGWYRDIEGALCLVIKEHLVSVRYDESTMEYHVCVDVLGPRGLFDKNLLWDSFGTKIPAKQCALGAVQRISEGTL